jgi:hypothetical protein
MALEQRYRDEEDSSFIGPESPGYHRYQEMQTLKGRFKHIVAGVAETLRELKDYTDKQQRPNAIKYKFPFTGWWSSPSE